MKSIVLLVILLTIQDITGTNEETLVSQSINSIEQVNNIIKQTNKNVFIAIKNKVIEFFDKLINIANEILKQLDKVIIKALNKIKKAEQLRIAIVDCMEENGKAIIEIPRKLLKNLGNCSIVQSKTGGKILYDNFTIGDILITILQQGLKTCGSTNESLMCIRNLIENAFNQFIQIFTAVIGRILKDALTFVKSEAEVITCKTAQLVTAVIESTKIGTMVMKCITDKIVKPLL